MKTLILAVCLVLSASSAFAGGRCIEWRHHHCVAYQHYPSYHHEDGDRAGVGVHMNVVR